MLTQENYERRKARRLEQRLETAAFASFCRNAEGYGRPDLLHTAFYGDPGVRAFWMAEARAWAEALGVAT